MVVLRQPKRKERLLSPVWGRLQYWSQIHQYVGVAIHVEAQKINQIQRWNKSLRPEDVQELERLRQDSHRVVRERRYYAIHTSLESIRKTQLYRTLPHEVGHYVDYLESVEQPARGNIDEELRLSDLYWNKSNKDKEAFAHQYATHFYEQWKERGDIPFERILDEKMLEAEGLDLSWFVQSKNPI